MPISVPTDVRIVGSIAGVWVIADQEATHYWLSRQRWNRATLLTTTA
jgi:hypothetical protein